MNTTLSPTDGNGKYETTLLFHSCLEPEEFVSNHGDGEPMQFTPNHYTFLALRDDVIIPMPDEAHGSEEVEIVNP